MQIIWSRIPINIRDFKLQYGDDDDDDKNNASKLSCIVVIVVVLVTVLQLKVPIDRSLTNTFDFYFARILLI